MGNTSAVNSADPINTNIGNTSSAAVSPNRGKKVISAKFRTAEKTGVLNLVDQDIKSSSGIWSKLLEPEIVQKLRSVDISSNQLKVLPLELYSLINLKTLICNNCNLQSTQDMTTLVRLTTLKLQNNDLEEHTLGPLSQTITHLYLSFNHFKEPPRNIFILPSIIHLDLSGNRLISLEGLEVMVTLVEVNLDDNLLQELPSRLALLVNLKFLSLKMNQIRFNSPVTQNQSIPKAIFEETQLDKIELKGNPITNREVMNFEGIQSFLERRKLLKERSFQGGGLLDHSLFGLD